MTTKSSPRRASHAGSPAIGRGLAAAFVLLLTATGTQAADSPPAAPLRVAVYDVPPYGSVEADGSIDGVSVDLWRRAAEAMGRDYRLVPVHEMEAILEGLERRDYDAAIGAITITPGRLARVDFSYPAHRSGVAVAVRKDSGPLAAFMNYGAVVAELSPLIALTLALLLVMGVAMWIAERPMRKLNHNSAVASLRDGVYWAVVTMTTVGYGDKTPKTAGGRMIAVLWMLVSVALISILSTSIISKMTADRLASGLRLTEADLGGRRLAAVAHSSGAEWLDDRRLRYAPFADLPQALTALEQGHADAVVNSVGALQYLIGSRFKGTVEPPQGVLEPAYMAVALPPGSALKKPLDRALIEITGSQEWRADRGELFRAVGGSGRHAVIARSGATKNSRGRGAAAVALDRRGAPLLVMTIPSIAASFGRVAGYTMHSISMEPTVQVAKWGDSLAIRIPAAVAEALELKAGDEVEIRVEGARRIRA